MDKQLSVHQYWDTVTIPKINLVALTTYIMSKIPFYTQALQRVNIELSDIKNPPGVGFTNGYKVFLHPRQYAIVEQLSKDNNLPWFKTPEIGFAFVILHEIGHIVFDSFGRLQHRDKTLWNHATDYQINQFVVKLMNESRLFKTQESYTQFLNVVNKHFLLDPAKYERLTSEETYSDLYKMSFGEGKGCKGNGPLANDLMDEDENSMSDEDRMTRDIVKSELSDYVSKNAKELAGIGSGMRDFQFMQEPPKINLKMVLKQISDRDVTEDWGYNSRGSRLDHLLPDNMRLPAIVDSTPDLVRKIFFVIDESGSISDTQLNDALNVAKECLEKYTRRPVHLILFTDRVEFSKPIKSHTDVVEKFSGGTAIKPVLEEIKRLRTEERIEPSTIIIFTDYFLEIDPTAETFKGVCKNAQKQVKWIISQGNPDNIPKVGSSYFIDEI